MAKATNPLIPGKVTKIVVRMYRFGTGDFFLLLFKSGEQVTFKMVIDCGCINANKDTFDNAVKDLLLETDKKIDLLVVTHEHADHINGFEKSAEWWSKFTIKKVWFAWTESIDSKEANAYRQSAAKTKLALKEVVRKLDKVSTPANDAFVKALSNFNELNAGLSLDLKSLRGADGILDLDANNLPTMEDFLRKHKIIRPETQVECLDLGKMYDDLPGAEGIRFFVLGPPKEAKKLNREEKAGENYEQRTKPSETNMAFVEALVPDLAESFPFEADHEWERADVKPQQVLTGKNGSPKYDKHVKAAYSKAGNEWRNIDHDWLAAAGGLALKYENSINNTSLVLAIQFADSERVLLFPGDAELGNWQSWHEPDRRWTLQQGDKKFTADATYLLNKTVFYKVGHHLSQNGTATVKGLDLMTSRDLTAMATLDFGKILNGWLKTMPNDLLSAELIRKTEGKLYLQGDYKIILKNILTTRTRLTISENHLDNFRALNEKFVGKDFIEIEVIG